MLIQIIFADHTVTDTDNPVCHVFDGIIMSNHDNGISVFLIHGFNQLQDLFGSIVVQSTGWLIAEQDIRVLYNRTSNGSTLLLTTGKLIGEFTLMICKTKCIKKFIHIQGMVA